MPPKKRVKYSREEDSALSLGVEKWGNGKWRDIWSDATLFADGRSFEVRALRSNVDLKDRWRVMKGRKTGTPGKRQRCHEVEAAASSPSRPEAEA